MNPLKFPLVRVAISFIIGLLIGFYFSLDLKIGFLLVLGGFSLLLLFYLLTEKKNINTIFFGISIAVISVVIGVFTQVLHNDLLNKKHYFHHISDNKQAINITLVSKLKPNANNYRYYADVNSLDNQRSNGKILVSISKDLYSKEPEIGSNFDVFSKIIPNSIVRNPHQFDYGKYLEKQKVYAQIYTDSVSIKKLGTHKTIEYYTYKIRTRILDNLRESGFSQEELAVFHALILGQQQDISPEIIQSYQYAGAIHILSVSGLHVAYIYGFISVVLLIFPNNKKGRLFKLLALLFSLWSFALLAGMAPAIVRAVTMFSFVSIGRFIGRNTNIIYTLLVSMLFILVCDPSFLFELGFQLSYLALFFIVWAKPILDKFYVPKNKITTYIWDVVTVSFAAQIGVLPLSLYYFGQFPTLFVITNLFILFPLSFFMIYGVIIALLAFLGISWFYTSKIMEFGIKYINQVSIQVAKLESFVFTDISFNFLFLTAWYLFIFSFFVWLNKRKFINLVYVLSSVVILQLAYIYKEVELLNTSEFIVFNKNNATLLAERKADKITFISNNFSTEDYIIKNYKVGSFSKLIESDSLNNLYYFNKKTILIIDKQAIYSENLFPDIIILIDSPNINLERLLGNHKPEIIVADASNYKSYIELWKKTCKKHKTRFHSTYQEGFYKIQ